MCLSASFSHSNFFATGQQAALENKHFFFKEDIHDYCMIPGTTVEALDKTYLLYLPWAYSVGFWIHPSTCLDPQHSLPVPNAAPGAAFQLGANAMVGFWAAESSVWGSWAQPSLGYQVPGIQVLGTEFILHSLAPISIYPLLCSV